MPSKPRFVALTQRVRQLYPHAPDPARLISAGQVRVDGVVVSNPRALVPEAIEVVTIDLSYLSLARAAPQLEAVTIAIAAELVALVKPMFELGLARPPADPEQRAKAVELAAAAFEDTGWHAPRSIESPVPGRRGAIEYLLHLRRAPGDDRKTAAWWNR